MARSVVLTVSPCDAVQSREEKPGYCRGWDLGFRVFAGSFEVDGPGRRCCRTRPGSFSSLAACRLLPFGPGECRDLRREFPGVVELLPVRQAGEGAVGELRQQAPDPLRLGAPQRQVVLGLDQEEPGQPGTPGLEPGLVLGVGRLEQIGRASCRERV